MDWACGRGWLWQYKVEKQAWSWCLPDFLALQKRVSLHCIACTVFLFTQGRLCQCGGSTLLDIHSSMICNSCFIANWSVRMHVHTSEQDKTVQYTTPPYISLNVTELWLHLQRHLVHFILLSVTCFPAFCWSAIPTSLHF